MTKQHYQQPNKYYPPHHFVFLPLMSFLFGWGMYQYIKQGEPPSPWLLFTILCGSILYLSIMLRQHYALGNQDRIIRIELRQRYFELTGRRFQLIEEQLSFSQIAALRFASDAEFEPLLNRTLTEKLTSDAIKKLIEHWQVDDMRL